MLCPQSVFMCFVRILEQTAIISLHIKRLVSITERVFTAPYGPNHNIQFRSRRGTRQKVMDRLDKERLCALYCSPNFIREFESRRMRRAGHVSYIRDRTVLWCGDLRDRPRGRTRCRWIILTWIFKTLDWEVMERIDILLDREKWWVFWMQHWTFEFHKIWEISWLSEGLIASHEAFCSIDLV